ncbi:hypothetical protein [Pseudoduganella violaceinigra]|uniref:hypothetical protein n=1 Tax=Pseudoduganella violaceinigra TaxID=246602 RepID=UPI00041AD9C7|nr:hypothetical protein [Pseudoduganella violaceinigra]
MKNNIFDIFYALGLALPLAVVAAALSLTVAPEFNEVQLIVAAGVLFVAWPVLARQCMEWRHAPQKRAQQRRLVTWQLLLPVAATGIMFLIVPIPHDYSGGLVWVLMCIIGATIVCTSWLGALIAVTFN